MPPSPALRAFPRLPLKEASSRLHINFSPNHLQFANSQGLGRSSHSAYTAVLLTTEESRSPWLWVRCCQHPTEPRDPFSGSASHRLQPAETSRRRTLTPNWFSPQKPLSGTLNCVPVWVVSRSHVTYLFPHSNLPKPLDPSSAACHESS